MLRQKKKEKNAMGSGAQSSASNPHPPSSGHPDDTLLVVGGYTDIDLLAHTPCVKSHNFVCVERSGGGKDGEIENDENLNALNAAFMTGGASSLKNKLKTGVHVLKMCGLTGALVHLSTNAIGPNVAFICASPVHKSLLCTYWAFPKSRHTVCPYNTDTFRSQSQTPPPSASTTRARS